MGEEDIGCWRFSIRNFLFSHFIYGMRREVITWSHFACDAIAVREGLLWLGSYDSALSKAEFSSIIDYIANY